MGLLRRMLFGAAAAACLAAPAYAWEADADPLKAEIDAFVSGLQANTNGLVTWDGSDPYEIKQDGDAAVATITHIRLSVHGKDLAQIALDRIEIRRSPDPSDSKLVKFSFVLPSEGTITSADGDQVAVTLKDGKADAVLEAVSEQAREVNLSLASLRIAEARSNSWINFGPLTGSSKVVPDDKGGFAGPTQVEWQKIEYSFPDHVTGGIDRIAYTGNVAGPNLTSLNTLRAQLQEMRKTITSPEARMKAMLDILPALATAYSQIKGEFAVQNITARTADGPVFALANASFSSDLSGLDGESAAFRVTLKHDGLDLAPSVLPPDKVPHRVVVDIGLDKVSTAALRAIFNIAMKMNTGTPAEKQAATPQLMGALAMLTPTFHIYDIAADLRDVGVDVTGVASGSPMSPQGYKADADVLVRGFAAIPSLAGAGAPLVQYLPLLQELATTTSDTPPRTKFHVGSAPPKWLTINGNDVSAWVIDTGTAPGQARLLKPAEPPMRGADVTAVQHALAAANVAVQASGVYDGPTAVAVARYQKQNGLNVSGAVDAATWQKLGVKMPAAPSPSPSAPSPVAPNRPGLRQK
ncbi:MAG TPA: peptidoglycan-binding domain-containing protein [Stellaceae bacterium]|nr:peptidoglycan-binding domain-containing protein [Stellaceae bacterium]